MKVVAKQMQNDHGVWVAKESGERTVEVTMRTAVEPVFEDAALAAVFE